MPKIETVREHIVDEYEIVKILKTLRDEPKLMFAVAIAWETGARIGEVVQLRAKDFSEEENLWICSVPTEKQRVKIHGQQPKRMLKINKDQIYEKIIKPIVSKQTDLEKPIVLPNSQETLRNKLKRRYPDVYFHWLRHCVSEDTKILTTNGWKNYNEVKIGDGIYSYNVEKDKIEMDSIKDLSIFHFKDDAYHVKNGHLDLLCTPEHNSVFNINKRKGEWTGFKIDTVDNIFNTKGIRMLKHKTSSKYNGDESIGVARASLLGWILTDGYIKKGGEIGISQSFTANPHKCKIIEQVLDASGVKYSKRLQSKKINKFSGEHYQMVNFNILKNTPNSNRTGLIPDHDWIYKYITKKRLPKYNILNLKQEEMVAIYTSMMLGDGENRGRELCTQNEYKLEFFRTLCSFIGKTAITNLGQHNMKPKGEMKFRTYITDKTDTNILLKKHITKEKYNGKMWCPTTNNGTWIAQRNGRVFITGNSRATIWSRKLDIFTLQYALGWQDIRMANIYVHQEQMSKKMGDILLG